MVANQPRASSRPSTTKSKSSSHASSASASTKPITRTPSLVQTSAKKATKQTGNPKKTSKFRDVERREVLDSQTTALLAEAGIGDKEEQRKEDPFSYGQASNADKRRTRRQVDEAAAALDLLMKS